MTKSNGTFDNVCGPKVRGEYLVVIVRLVGRQVDSGEILVGLKYRAFFFFGGGGTGGRYLELLYHPKNDSCTETASDVGYFYCFINFAVVRI